MPKKIIYAEDAIDALAHEWDGMVTSVFDVIKSLPSAQPQCKGRWVQISPAKIYECSICGKNVMTSDIDAYDFCHGCGADMRGGQE